MVAVPCPEEAFGSTACSKADPNLPPAHPWHAPVSGTQGLFVACVSDWSGKPFACRALDHEAVLAFWFMRDAEYGTAIAGTAAASKSGSSPPFRIGRVSLADCSRWGGGSRMGRGWRGNALGLQRWEVEAAHQARLDVTEALAALMRRGKSFPEAKKEVMNRARQVYKFNRPELYQGCLACVSDVQFSDMPPDIIRKIGDDFLAGIEKGAVTRPGRSKGPSTISRGWFSELIRKGLVPPGGDSRTLQAAHGAPLMHRQPSAQDLVRAADFRDQLAGSPACPPLSRLSIRVWQGVMAIA